MMGHFISRLFEGTLHVDKIHVRFKIANPTYALPVPVQRQTDFPPKRVVVSRLHDSVAKFRTGVKFSLRYSNRDELTPGWLAPTWRVVVVSSKQIYSHEREPEWPRAGAKVAPVSSNHALSFQLKVSFVILFRPAAWEAFVRRKQPVTSEKGQETEKKKCFHLRIKSTMLVLFAFYFFSPLDYFMLLAIVRFLVWFIILDAVPPKSHACSSVVLFCLWNHRERFVQCYISFFLYL